MPLSERCFVFPRVTIYKTKVAGTNFAPTNKKPKKKYRGKSKKVWKYKTKTKKKKVTEKDYWARDDYVYYIGSF